MGAKNAREPISKRRRFKLFARDDFTCQYCGRRSPEVVLELDHVVAVCAGGSSEDENLVTSCFDCNRGKAGGTLQSSAPNTAERAALLKERMEQVSAYERLLKKQRRREEAAINGVVEIYERSFEGWTLLDRARLSIRNFVRKLPSQEVSYAMEVACARVDKDRAFKYFCGVCWRMIKDGN